MTQHANIRAAGQEPATDDQRAFLRSLVDEFGAKGAARQVSMNQLSLLRALAGLPVLRGTLALVDAAQATRCAERTAAQ